MEPNEFPINLTSFLRLGNRDRFINSVFPTLWLEITIAIPSCVFSNSSFRPHCSPSTHTRCGPPDSARSILFQPSKHRRLRRKPTRDRLIGLYCPEKHREAAKSYGPNKDCLVKPLFGRKRQSIMSRAQIFSLRNFSLHFDQIKEIGFQKLHALNILFAMADALAVLHWHAKIDAMDIEVVLGSSPTEEQKVRRVINKVRKRPSTPNRNGGLPTTQKSK